MSATLSNSLHLKRAGPTASIVLDRPPLNVLNLESLHELNDMLEMLAADSSIKSLQLRGMGRAFCAGVDVADHTVERAPDMLRAFDTVLLRLLEFPVPTVAVVHGPALGGGCELAMACDVVIAELKAIFGQPEVALASMPPFAMVLLPRLIGWQQAADLIFSGRSIGAEEAHRIGLAQYVVPLDALDDFASGYCRRLNTASGPVLRLIKRGMLEARRGRPADAVGWCETLYRDQLLSLSDPAEGINAFLEKRKPVWQEC